MKQNITTLESLAAYINTSDEWPLDVSDIIEANGWQDNTGTEYGICESDTQILSFDELGSAVVRSI